MSKVTCVDINGKQYEVDAAGLRWRVSAYGIIIKEGKILLSPQFGDKHDLPGGGLEIFETVEAGVIREVKEETGIDVKNPRLVGFSESNFMFSHAEGDAFHCLMLYFACQFVGGELSTEGFDEWEKEYAEMAEWIDLEKIDKIKVASSVDYRPFIKKALK